MRTCISHINPECLAETVSDERFTVANATDRVMRMDANEIYELFAELDFTCKYSPLLDSIDFRVLIARATGTPFETLPEPSNWPFLLEERDI